MLWQGERWVSPILFIGNSMPGNVQDDWSFVSAPPLTEARQRELSDQLVERLQDGDDRALAELFAIYEDRLLRLIDYRLDRSLHSRVDPTDILQDAYIDASERVAHFFSRPDSSIAVWLRLIVLQPLQLVVRHHLLTDKRDARKEVSMGRGTRSQPLGGIAQLLADSLTSPSAVVARTEAVDMVEQILEEMSESDREVLALRHFEQVTNDEVSEILGISVKAASNRYVRALARLKDLIHEMEVRGEVRVR